MFSSLARGANLARRGVAPATYFGTGVACHWAWGREETVPQLMACSTAASWSLVAGCARCARNSLPEEAEWPREQLAKVESAELRFLAKVLVDGCADKGLDSAWLRSLALRRICQVAEMNPRGLAISGLVPPLVEDPESTSGSSNDARPTSSSSGLAELANLINNTAAALDATSTSSTSAAQRAAALMPLSTALKAILESQGDRSSAQELGSEGCLSIANAASLAAQWLAEERRRVALAAAAMPKNDVADTKSSSSTAWKTPVDAEDEEFVVERLCAVYEALAQPPFAALLRSGRSLEAKQRRVELDETVKGLSAVPSQPPSETRWPAKEFLPEKLCSLMAAATQGGRFRSSRAPVASHTTTKAPSGRITMVIEAGAWLAVIGTVVVAVSQDGFKLLGFHAIPEQYRPAFHHFILEPAVKVEELIAKYQPGGHANEEGITLGPCGAQSNA